MSIAQLDEREQGLRYVAADGAGAEQIAGVVVPAGTGLGNLVAATGQAMSIDRVSDDPRFARHVAESTGYVPTAMLIVPIPDDRGEVIGVLSILDRERRNRDDLELASSFAALAVPALAQIDLAVHLGPLLLTAAADAIVDDTELADALRDQATAAAAATDDTIDELASIAALLVELRDRGPEARLAVERVLRELLTLSRPRRRR